MTSILGCEVAKGKQCIQKKFNRMKSKERCMNSSNLIVFIILLNY